VSVPNIADDVLMLSHMMLCRVDSFSLFCLVVLVISSSSSVLSVLVLEVGVP